MSGTAIAYALVAGVATFVVGMLVARPIIYFLAGAGATPAGGAPSPSRNARPGGTRPRVSCYYTGG